MAQEAAKLTADAIGQESKAFTIDEAQGTHKRWAKISQSQARIAAMMKLAQSAP